MTALGEAQGNRMRETMSANGAAAWKHRRFCIGGFCTGAFCAGLSALARCAFKNPARWAGLSCRRALGACCRRHRRVSATWSILNKNVAVFMNYSHQVFTANVTY
jgi:hypothetical protein